MTDTLLTKIGNWIRKGNRIDGGLPLVSREIRPNGEIVDSRTRFLRPWAKRDQAISNLQTGVTALSDLMDSIRGNLESQGRRQEELMGYLAHLPKAIEGIPESNRVQGETLKAIHQQIAHQSGQQTRLADILERISTAADEHRSTLDAVHGRVETLHSNDQTISTNLSGMGTALSELGRNSQEGTRVLESLNQCLSERDSDLKTILHKQAARFTTMLTIAIFLAIAALAAVAVVGYLGYTALNKLQ